MSAEENLVSRYGSTAQVKAMVLTAERSGSKTPSWPTVTKTLTGWRQNIGSDLRILYERRELNVTHKIFVAEDPGASEGDVIVIEGVTHLIRGIINQAGLSRLWRIDCEETR